MKSGVRAWHDFLFASRERSRSWLKNSRYCQATMGNAKNKRRPKRVNTTPPSNTNTAAALITPTADNDDDIPPLQYRDGDDSDNEADDLTKIDDNLTSFFAAIQTLFTDNAKLQRKWMSADRIVERQSVSSRIDDTIKKGEDKCKILLW